MADVLYYQTMPKRRPGSWVYKLILYVTFVWAGLFPAVCYMYGSSFYFGYGNLLNTSSGVFTSTLAMVLAEGLIAWLGFEIIFWLYRLVLSFKIYSFVVPMTSLKNTSRAFYAVKNLIYGGLLFLCFWFPYLYIFMPIFDLVLILSLLVVFSIYIQKNYSQPIIAHFVFKNFSYPVFVYECIVLLVSVLEVLL